MIQDLYLSMSGADVVGCVMPHSVTHVRGILKLAFLATIKGNNMFLEKEPLLLFYFMKGHIKKFSMYYNLDTKG